MLPRREGADPKQFDAQRAEPRKRLIRSRSRHELPPILNKLTHAQGHRPPAQNPFRAVPSVSVRSDVVPPDHR